MAVKAVKTVEDHFRAETFTQPYFPRMNEGWEKNGNLYMLHRQNLEWKEDIDFFVTRNGVIVAALDVEHRENGWGYREWSVPVLSRRHATGENNRQNTSMKYQYIERWPEFSFFIAMREDYKETITIWGRDVVDGVRRVRSPGGMYTRPFPVMCVKDEKVVHCEPFDNHIEEFIVGKLEGLPEEHRIWSIIEEDRTGVRNSVRDVS